jgi:PIN domain nuclease of toxin-antitoxin system
MNYLLDTQVLIWAAISPKRLPPRVRQELINPMHTLFLSDVSVWEMQMKADVGKSAVGPAIKAFVTQQAQALKLNQLAITKDHIFGLAELAFYQV